MAGLYLVTIVLTLTETIQNDYCPNLISSVMKKVQSEADFYQFLTGFNLRLFI